MRRKVNAVLVDEAASVGHNQPPFEWKPNPDVTHRDVGVVPGCVQPNTRTFHTHKDQAPDCDWLDYVTPNASTWSSDPKTRDQFREKSSLMCATIEEVNAHSKSLVEQMEWAWAAWQAGKFMGDFALEEFKRYFQAKIVLAKPSWATSPINLI
jgi:hypothetical protein